MTRCVADEGIARMRQTAHQGGKNCEPTEAGVEYANGGGRTSVGHGLAPSAGAASSVKYVRVRSAWPARVGRSIPSTRKRTSVMVGRLARNVAQIERSVSDSGSSPAGWLSAKVPVKLT